MTFKLLIIYNYFLCLTIQFYERVGILDFTDIPNTKFTMVYKHLHTVHKNSIWPNNTAILYGKNITTALFITTND